MFEGSIIGLLRFCAGALSVRLVLRVVRVRSRSGRSVVCLFANIFDGLSGNVYPLFEIRSRRERLNEAVATVFDL